MVTASSLEGICKSMRHSYSVYLGLELELRNELQLQVHNCKVLHPEELMHLHIEHLVLISYATD